ncbi:Holocytochrome c synthase/heme-lyase [Ostreococcus tauri]|uniref:Holocytochrome c-type synthase n=1 Tax=Ostreococcus tauri TaxID=70448 RepID=A0A1Y5IB22_OSTTA|nr:Holocytochrome c synthase/heme-lyase [Ostreococcus tauri]
MGAKTSKPTDGENDVIPPCEGGRAAYERARSSENTDTSTCPVPEEYRGNLGTYNVYNTKVSDRAGSAPSKAQEKKSSWFGFGASALDPRNNMPSEPNQRRAPGQREKLSVNREPSTIPKSGSDGGVWTYPSPQMFYNALVRKNKADDVEESDMESVVMVHNAMNEDTWRRVAQWEKLHEYTKGRPMLLRFRGRPDELSPLALARLMFGGARPFDRHDWYVDREGREVRYVIDYYFNEEKAGTSEQFDVVVRPALDTPEALLDRVKMSIYVACARLGLPCPISGHGGTIDVDP